MNLKFLPSFSIKFEMERNVIFHVLSGHLFTHKFSSGDFNQTIETDWLVATVFGKQILSVVETKHIHGPNLLCQLTDSTHVAK